MEFVHGTPLSQSVSESPLPATRVAEYVQQVASAIHVAHENGIIHRDLASRNVLLDGLSNALIADFGLSAKTFGTQNNAKQEVGFFRGPYKWMAPESLKFNQFFHRKQQHISLGKKLNLVKVNFQIFVKFII